jgi:hypothetical protein
MAIVSMGLFVVFHIPRRSWNHGIHMGKKYPGPPNLANSVRNLQLLM